MTQDPRDDPPPDATAADVLACGGAERVLRKIRAVVGAVHVVHKAHECCHHCGAGNAHEATHCVACGCPLADPVQSTEPTEET